MSTTVQQTVVHVNLSRRRITINGHAVYLTATEALLMVELCVQDRTVPCNRASGSTVARLRRKLASIGAGGLIETAYGRGYVLCPDARVSWGAA